MKSPLLRLLAGLCLLVLLVPAAQAQISEGGTPPSFERSLKSTIPTVRTAKLDVPSLLAQDAMEESKGVPFRFGYPFDVNYTLNNSGTWDTLANGDRIWRLAIECPGAYSINLIYDSYLIPNGARFFVYSGDEEMVLGAFTSRNIKNHGKFSTAPVKGDRTVLEYYEPAEVSGQGQIEVSRIVHGYKDVFFDLENAKDALGFGGSGSCNNNVNCPEGAPWEAEKRSVAMITTSGGFRLCSGSMINNVRQDLTPYFLTANHCLGGEETWVFIFNYESPTCDNIDGPTWMSVSGSTLRASNSYSDFALLELSAQPPDSYSVFYGGWSAMDVASQQTTAIHHPSGDIKKISFDYDSLTSANYLGSPGSGESHWRVGNWEDGTTEGGSSGSPIYNENHHVVGQLHGGYASCASITPDWYGKFSQSWDYGSSASNRLKDWLDPDNTGTMVLDGREQTGVSITHTPLEDTQDTLNPYTVTAEVTSTTALIPESLLVNYQVGGFWYTDTMTATGGTDEYEGFIPAQSPGALINYYLSAFNVDGETDTTDTFTFKVLAWAFSLTPSYVSDSAAVADTAWYDLSITNNGSLTDDYNLSVLGNVWATTIWDASGSTQISSTGSMAPDDQFEFKVAVIIPTSVYGDTDVAQLTATSSDNPGFSETATIETMSSGEPLIIPVTDQFSSTTVDQGLWVYNTGGTSNEQGLDEPSAPYSLNLDGDPTQGDTLITQLIDLSGQANVVLRYFYQRTGDGDSPENNDDLWVQYVDSSGDWQTLDQHLGSGEDMTTFEEVEHTLPLAAMHDEFRIRIYCQATSGDFDDWFIDDFFLGLPPNYDVRVSPSESDQMGAAGDSAVYGLTVINRGLLDDSYDLTSTGDWDVAFFDATGTNIITNTGTVPANDSVDIVAKVAVPSDSYTNEVDTSTVLATSAGDGGMSDQSMLITTSVGAPGLFPWYESFPDDTLYTTRWLYNSASVVTSNGVLPPSEPYSIAVDGGNDTLVSQLIDLEGVSEAVLAYYYEAGGSGDVPEVGEDLFVEYKDNLGNWIQINQHAGDGVAMQSFKNVTLRLPADALHKNFQVRFHALGSCEGCDIWYLDDISVDYTPAIAVAPADLYETLLTGDSSAQELIISNEGQGSVSYSLVYLPIVKNQAFKALLESGEVEPAWRYYPEGFDEDFYDHKGVEDTRVGHPVEKNAGGPDAYGYYWIDSDEAGGPLFDWKDISGSAANLVGQFDDDNYAGPFEMGFAFPYYDSVYTQIYIGSNGIIGFGPDNMDSRFKTSIPSTGDPNNILAWLWDDLNPTDADNPGAGVFVDTSDGMCIIQFQDYPEYGAGPGETVTAQIILKPNGTITYQYLSIDAGFDSDNCAVGIENHDGTDGLEVAYLSSYLKDSLAIEFVPPGRWLSLEGTSGLLAAGESDTVMCHFNTTDMDTGLYYANLVVTSNDPDASDNPWTVPVELTVTDVPQYICGDIDGDGSGPNVADVTYLVGFLFNSGPPPPVMDAADVNGDGQGPNVSDLTFLVQYLFGDGTTPDC
ncbi:hypothetical protein GF356_08500 [candidate division GN15 bacterium]|nr:hypothetical protein [candidate division GN15 bacterium]